MRRLLWIFCCVCTLFGLVGCGDTPHLVMRDVVTFLNEWVDYMNRIPDDDTAEDAAAEFSKNPAYLLKIRAEYLKHRFDIFDMDKDKEVKKERLAAALFWKDELEVTIKRFVVATKRLESIKNRLVQEAADREKGPGRTVMVGTTKELQDQIDAFAARNETLIVVEPEKASPKFAELGRKLEAIANSLGRKSAPLPEKKKKEDH